MASSGPQPAGSWSGLFKSTASQQADAGVAQLANAVAARLSLKETEPTRNPTADSDSDSDADAAPSPVALLPMTLPVTSRVLVRKNRRGNVVRLVREHYLRKDIPCQSPSCAACARVMAATRQAATDGTTTTTTLRQSRETDGVAQSLLPMLPPKPSHLLIPDVQEPDMTGIVFAQTCAFHIMNHGTGREYNKLRGIVSDPRHASIVFSNENSVDTFSPRRPEGESLEQHGSRLVLQMALYYLRHLPGEFPIVVVNDSINDATQIFGALASGLSARDAARIRVQTMADYLGEFHAANSVLRETQHSIRLALDEVAALHTADAVVDPESMDTAPTLASSAGPATLASLQAAVQSYPQYLSAEEADEEVRAGRLVRGTLQVSRGNAQIEAFVKRSRASWTARSTATGLNEAPQPETADGQNSSAKTIFAAIDEGKGMSPDDILVLGMRDRNRACHGDVVAVALLPKAQWQSQASLARLGKQKGSVPPSDNNALSQQLIPTGRVVAIVQRQWRDYVCTIVRDSAAAQSTSTSLASTGANVSRVLCVPMDSRIPKIRIATRQAVQLEGQRLVVRIDRWEYNSQYPTGHLVNSLGPIENLDTETAAILVEHDIVLNPPSERQLQELPVHTPESPWQLPPDQAARRRDIRDSLVMSIDPLGSKDVDDALSVRRLTPAEQQYQTRHLAKKRQAAKEAPLSTAPTYELGVHIADVSYFVKENSLTDVEARARSTTIYLADRRFDMLPAVLSEQLCSLLSCEDRCAMSVIWILDENYDMLDVWYGRTLLRSSFQLYYELAQDIATHAKPDPELAELVRELRTDKSLTAAAKLAKIALMREAIQLLMQVARKFRADRIANGALELEGTEIRFKFDENHTITDVVPKRELEIHKTVAEAMILANHYVARQIATVFPTHALLRHHTLPSKSNLDRLVAVATACGFSMDVTSNKTIADSLDACVVPGDPSVNKMIRTLATQAMSEAAYVSTGMVQPSELYHYGLALDYYTHFTSPIRRYADVYVHRQLMASLAADNPQREEYQMLSNPNLSALADHINVKHRMSKVAQEASTEMFQALYFKARLEDDDARRLAQSGAAVPEKEDEARSKVVADGIVCALRSDSATVFVPDYGVKGNVHFVDAAGHVQLPATFASAAALPDASSLVGGTIERRPESLVVTSPHLDKPLTVKLFDHLTVRVMLHRSQIHRDTLRLQLFGPAAPQQAQQQQKPQAGFGSKSSAQAHGSKQSSLTSVPKAADAEAATDLPASGTSDRAPSLPTLASSGTSYRQIPSKDSFYQFMLDLRQTSVLAES
ncbi:DIS3-like exonuclease 1 [Capsaspora owczarzaki ATCC 30864]|uniref:DIS3-like exonuclease 1 n=1 Tax=Capsaspora owczarzaki (strain ATCC 30864) TaxID=595528 RepID=A0A0D2VQY1_CAPO3|nr:DIS3-like exonuclease 1 [Capsaspora owczarzaki ATCC 30864]